jgi:hypothetical protein
MWLGALLLSLIVVPYGTTLLFGQAWHLGRDNWSFAIFPLFVVSTASVYLCDVAIVIEAFKSKGQGWVRSRLDWLVWISAAVLSAWCVWLDVETVRAYQLQGGLRLDLILVVGLDALMLFFDAALIALAVKTRRTA